MPKIYSQNTKISDAVGRSEYIAGITGKQEEVVVHKVNMRYDWEFYSEYEKNHQHQAGDNQRQNEAREIIIALPNDLAHKDKNKTSYEQKEKLIQICDDLVKNIIGENHDYEFAVHWNSNRTNLHVHIMFSERVVINEIKPKVYKKDIWKNEATGKLAKPESEGAVLVHKKGDVLVDKNGDIMYSMDVLTAKDRKFKNHSFMAYRDIQIKNVMEKYGYSFEIQDDSTPFLSQRKLYKYANNDYLKSASLYNEAVKEYNNKVRTHLGIEPLQLHNYCDIRNDVESSIKLSNSMEKKISNAAIQTIHAMVDKVKIFIHEASFKVQTNVVDWWTENKEEYLKAFMLQTELSKGDNYGTRGTGVNESDNKTKSENIRIGEQSKSIARDSTSERIAALRNSTDCRGITNEDSIIQSIRTELSADRKIKSGITEDIKIGKGKKQTFD